MKYREYGENMKHKCYSDGKIIPLATKNPLKCTFQGGQN